MISKMSSQQLMDILDNSVDSIDELRSEINSAEAELEKRLAVVNNGVEYSLYCIEKINKNIEAGQSKNNNLVLFEDSEISGGTYNKFGISVLPVCTVNPTNIFNFQSTTGPIFKNNLNLYVNDEINLDMLEMMKDDDIKGKSMAFAEFESPSLTLKVVVNPNDLFGSTTFNTIELSPFLNGSFDITSIKIFSMQDYRNSATIPTYSNTTAIKSAGACKIILDDAIDLYSIEIGITVNFKNSAGKYPFGLRHLYFLNANYNTASNIIVKITKNNYIDWVSDDIVVSDQKGYRESTCTEEGIKVYTNYVNGSLSGEVSLVKGIAQNSIAKNVKELYVYIPIKRCITSVKFKNIEER